MKTPDKKKSIVIIVVVIIILLGIFAVKRAKSREENKPVAKQYPVVVRTIKPVETNVRLTLPYLAIAQNDKDVNVASKIAARIRSIKPSGSRVKRGEIIARLDNVSISSKRKSIDAQIQAVNISLANLKETHKRTQELLGVGGASVEQSQIEESKIAELEAKKEALSENVNDVKNLDSYALIVSPVNGIISKTMANAGDMAMPGKPLANLRSFNGFSLLLRMPSDIKVSGVFFKKRYFQVIPLNSTFNGLAEYKVYVDQTSLASGDRVEIDVEVYSGDAVQLPFDAILSKGGKDYVFLKEGDKGVAHQVHIVQTGEQGAVVNDSSISGKEIIVAKQDILLKIMGGVLVTSKIE